MKLQALFIYLNIHVYIFVAMDQSNKYIILWQLNDSMDGLAPLAQENGCIFIYNKEEN